MSPRLLRLRDRPGDPIPEIPSSGSLSHRILKGLRTALCLVFALTTVALAQPPREDPGNDPGTGSAIETWQVLAIPGLPESAVLGDLWVAPNGHVYVWVKYPSASVGIEFAPDGEKLPETPGAPKPWSSALYRYDGMRWSSVLRTPGEIGNALLGSGTNYVFATTTSQTGEVRFYKFNGTNWLREIVPGYHSDRIHTLAGVPGDLFLKVGNVVLHNNGSGFRWFYELPASEAAVRGLVYLNATHLFVMCPDGQYEWDTGTWTACNDAYAFTDVEDAWGMRDALGTLQMYAVGSGGPDNGLRVWRFIEGDPIAHTGSWDEVVADPAGSGVPNIGSGMRVWGTAANDVYATGVVAGEGHIMRFDGTTWQHLAPPAVLGTVRGVWGTGDGVVWFSAESGQVIRYGRPDVAPIVPGAAAVGERAPMVAEVNHGTLTVRYALTAPTPVKLGVYDIMGRQLGTIEDGIREPGTHEASWNLGTLDSGIYFVKLHTRGAAFVRRVVVIR